MFVLESLQDNVIPQFVVRTRWTFLYANVLKNKLVTIIKIIVIPQKTVVQQNPIDWEFGDKFSIQWFYFAGLGRI